MPPRPNQARREQLLAELETILLTEGFLHLRVGALASRLKCSRSTLYELAESKEELFARVVERFRDSVVREAIERAEAHASPADKLVTLLEVVADRQPEGSPAFWRDVRADEATRAVFDEGRSWGVHRAKQYLDEGVADGTFRPANTDFLAHVIWLAGAASRDPAVLERTNIDSGEAVREIERLLISGLAGGSVEE